MCGMLRLSGEGEGRSQGKPERQELGSIFDRGRNLLPQVFSFPFLPIASLILRSLLLEHLRKFPVSATGGLMLAKYVASFPSLKTCQHFL